MAKELSTALEELLSQTKSVAEDKFKGVRNIQRSFSASMQLICQAPSNEANQVHQTASPV